MIIDLKKLTKDQNILFDKLFNDSKLEYINLIDKIFSKSDKSILFLLSSVTSRDIFLNDTLIKLTQLRFIKHYIINQKIKTIVLYDNNQVFIDYDNCSLPIDSKSVNNFPVPILNIKTNNTNFDGKKIGVLLIKHLFANYNSMYNNHHIALFLNYIQLFKRF